MKQKRNLGMMVLMFAFMFMLPVAKAAYAVEKYDIDASHSSVMFRVKHLGVSFFYGRFHDVSGTFTVDEKKVGNSSIDVTIKTNSIDTHSEKRDGHLKGPDFFNVKAFPVITFKGKSYKKLEDDKGEISGDLTLHGVTKTVTFTMDRVGSGKDPWGGYRSGFEGTFKLKRSDYGMTFMLDGVGDEITVVLSIEGVRK